MAPTATKIFVVQSRGAIQQEMYGTDEDLLKTPIGVEANEIDNMFQVLKVQEKTKKRVKVKTKKDREDEAKK